MTEICFLGTGGWIATPKRDNLSFILNHNKDLILVESSGSVVQKIKKLGFEPKKITAILISHIHPDHVFGLPSLVHSLIFDDCTLRIWGSKATVDFCRELLTLFHLLDAGHGCRIQFSVLEEGKSVELRPSLICTPLAVHHHPSSLGFLLDFKKENKRLLYSGDTGSHPPLFRAARDLDFLLHDCSAPHRFFLETPSLSTIHSHSRELGRMAKEAGVRTLVPCHFFSNYDFEIAEIVDEIREHFDENLIIPEDMQKLTLF